jgi:hypothetical protein
MFAGLGAERLPHLGMTPYLQRGCDPWDATAPLGGEPYEPQPGDIYFGWAGNVLSKSAYLLVRAGPPSHNGMFVRLPNGEMMVLEATTNERQYGDRPGVYLRPALWRLQTYQGPVWIRRLCDSLTPDESDRLTCFALDQVGKPFAFRRSVTLAPFFRPVKGRLGACLTGPAQLDRSDWFCSEMVTAAGILLGRLDACRVRPSCIDPRDMFLDRALDLSRGWHKPAQVCWEPAGCATAP